MSAAPALFSDVLLDVFVPGEPQPQGSSRGFINPKTGRIIITSDNAKLKPWRRRIAESARAAYTRDNPTDAPIVVEATFYLPRPKSLPKRVLFPTKIPDADKLARGLLDGLAGVTDKKRPERSIAGIYRGDQQVVTLIVHKRYATTEPGVQIRVTVLS